MNDANHSAVDGEILAHGSDARHFRILLASGEEITAVLSRNREFGCLFGSLVGWKVKVVFPKPPKIARVIDLVRPLQTNGGS